MKTPARVCLVPFARNVGGPASFQHRLAAGLANRGIQVCHDLDDTPYDAILVIGGTRYFGKLKRALRKGIPVIQRLNGMNWLHRKRKTGLRHYLKAEYGNFLLSTIRGRLASGIVYQSHFVKGWWEGMHGPTPAPDQVTYNGVDLQTYSPEGPHERPEHVYRLLLVEGRLGGGYEIGLKHAAQLTQTLTRDHNMPVELFLAGEVPDKVRVEWEERSPVDIQWGGLIPGDLIPRLDRSAHLLFSGDLNAACPNAVIEALACGLPVVSFDTGALPELVKNDAGRIVPYGGDSWKLDPPDIPALAAASAEILQNQEPFRSAARAHAETFFGLEDMVEGYLKALTENW